MIPSEAVQRILYLFHGRRRVGDGFTAFCPACRHQDVTLRITEGPDGEPIVGCLKGCPEELIRRKAGMDAKRLQTPAEAAGGTLTPAPLPENDPAFHSLPDSRGCPHHVSEFPDLAETPPSKPRVESTPQWQDGEHSIGRSGVALSFLRALLKAGPVAAKDALEHAKAVGVAERTLKRVKKRLGVQSLRCGSGSLWVLAGQEGQDSSGASNV